MKNYFKILLFLIFIVVANSIFIVDERQQAIITQFGKPVGNAITEAGLKFKLPLMQTVIKFDKRLLEWDGAVNEIPTKDNKYILVDTFARWKISDPLEFYKSAKNTVLAQSRLDDIIDGAVRDEIANRVMGEIVRSTDREMVTYASDSGQENSQTDSEVVDNGARLEIINSILNKVKNKLLELEMGIEVVDVQIKRVTYNKQVQAKLFNRMISEQNMIAEKYRAQGQGSKQEILGKQIQKEKEIMSDAYLKSQNIKGKADAEATDIYAKSYGKSPEFYNYLRTLETYKKTLDSTTLFILSTDNKYLKFIEQ
tara:strand:+ start:1000 stop:1932 length:933 start_codon:yes stop_codon:yes gene_type:complete